mmetsp:Transcript_14491/g.30826  ORF Transcript_14491/g.30826 Transcript_14491/m.30826 type:complete len:99 (+) Transcript_14491:203-499(+)
MLLLVNRRDMLHSRRKSPTRPAMGRHTQTASMHQPLSQNITTVVRATKTGVNENLFCLKMTWMDLNHVCWQGIDEKSLQNVQVVVNTSIREDNSAMVD